MDEWHFRIEIQAIQRSKVTAAINTAPENKRSAAYVTSQVHTSVSAATHVCLFH